MWHSFRVRRRGLVVAMLALASTPAGADAPDPCALLTPEIAGAALGAAVDAPPRSDAAYCGYMDAEYRVAAISLREEKTPPAESAQAWADDLNAEKTADAATADLPDWRPVDIGGAMAVGQPSDDSASVFVAAKGLGLMVFGPDLERTTALARAVSARLP